MNKSSLKLEKFIFKIIKDATEPVSALDIKKNRIIRNINYKNIKIALRNLTKQKLIKQSSNNLYWTKDNDNIIFANVIKINKTFCFVRLDTTNEEMFIPGRYMMGALPGDKVIVKKFVTKTGSLLEGKILAIESRGSGEYFGRIKNINNYYFFSSSEINFPLLVDISENQSVLKQDILDDKLIKIKIVYRGKDNDEHVAKIESIIGSATDPESCCKLILQQKNIKQKFDDKVLKLADKIASEKISETEYQNRLDLRDEIIFTIDGKDSKDLDDAVSIKKLENNFWELGVHIADVSYYVTQDSYIDKEAFERGTSIYYANSVIPMLPKALSNNICSLNPDEDRLAFSVLINLDSDGKIVSYNFKKSIIKSKIKGVYHEINQILDGVESDEVRQKYKHVRENIFLMQELCEILNKKRLERGSLELESRECKIEINKNNIVNILSYERGKAEIIIEEFMLKANEAAAMFAQAKKIPFIYRIHENPPSDKFLALSQVLVNLNLPRLKNNSQQELSKIINSVKDTKLQFVVNNIILRSLAKAKYSSEYKPHYGLGLANYSHFTSPIRRYPDLMIHRIMNKYLGNSFNNKFFEDKVSGVALQSSECEKNADSVERECEDIYKAFYMSRFIGEVFDGVVSSVASHGFYVQLENTVEGLVHKNSLPDGEYELINMIEFRNLKDSKFNIKIGDAIKVKLIKTDVFSGQIDFEII